MLLPLSPNALQGLQAEKLPWRAPAGSTPWYWFGAQKVPAPSSQQFKPYAWASGFQVSSFANLHWLWSSVFYIPEKYPSQQATVHVSLSYKNQTILARKSRKGRERQVIHILTHCTLTGSTCHIITVVSLDPVASLVPSLENLQNHTSLQCSVSICCV